MANSNKKAGDKPVPLGYLVLRQGINPIQRFPLLVDRVLIVDNSGNLLIITLFLLLVHIQTLLVLLTYLRLLSLILLLVIRFMFHNTRVIQMLNIKGYIKL